MPSYLTLAKKTAKEELLGSAKDLQVGEQPRGKRLRFLSDIGCVEVVKSLRDCF